MDFTLTPEQQSFRDEVRDWLKRNLPQSWIERLHGGSGTEAQRGRHDDRDHGPAPAVNGTPVGRWGGRRGGPLV